MHQHQHSSGTEQKAHSWREHVSKPAVGLTQQEQQESAEIVRSTALSAGWAQGSSRQMAGQHRVGCAKHKGTWHDALFYWYITLRRPVSKQWETALSALMRSSQYSTDRQRCPTQARSCAGLQIIGPSLRLQGFSEKPLQSVILRKTLPK